MVVRVEALAVAVDTPVRLPPSRRDTVLDGFGVHHQELGQPVLGELEVGVRRRHPVAVVAVLELRVHEPARDWSP